VNAANAKNTSVGLENTAEDQKKKIPALTDWLERLAELIKQIRRNFKTANTTLTEVKKPFPKFDDLTSMLGSYVFLHVSNSYTSIEEHKNIL
jgi:hypothetical protein